MAKKDEFVYPETIDNYPTQTKKTWRKAQNTNSRKTAIRAHCLLCCGGSTKSVKDCTSPECPLFKFRITG